MVKDESRKREHWRERAGGPYRSCKDLEDVVQSFDFKTGNVTDHVSIGMMRGCHVI